MREHRYRAKNKQGEWVYGDLIRSKQPFIVNGVIESNEEYITIEEWCPVRGDTIGQFTGLKDKSGKEIYEGDIVKWDDNSNGKYVRVCEIRWVASHYELIGYAFNLSSPQNKWPMRFTFGSFAYEYNGALEVIGNIHDNKDLLCTE